MNNENKAYELDEEFDFTNSTGIINKKQKNINY
jgi:hypothetical protein